jgi:hypothetical protein
LCSERVVAEAGALPAACSVGESSGRLPQSVEAFTCVRGDLRNGTDDRLSLRPPDFDRRVEVLVDDELERPSEPQAGGCMVGLPIGEAGAEEVGEPAGFQTGQRIGAGADEDRLFAIGPGRHPIRARTWSSASRVWSRACLVLKARGWPRIPRLS